VPYQSLLDRWIAVVGVWGGGDVYSGVLFQCGRAQRENDGLFNQPPESVKGLCSLDSVFQRHPAPYSGAKQVGENRIQREEKRREVWWLLRIS